MPTPPVDIVPVTGLDPAREDDFLAWADCWTSSALHDMGPWNAVENAPMLGVNRAMGYAVTGHLREWQRTA